MDILKRNIEALKLYKSYFWNDYCKVDLEKSDCDLQIVKNQAKDGNFYLSIQKEEEVIRLNSSYKPYDEAEKWAQKYTFPNLCTVIEMFGLGNGLFVRELMKKMKKDDSLIIYEPSLELFRFCLENFDFVDLIENQEIFLFVEGVNTYRLKNYLEYKVRWYNMKFQSVIDHPQYRKISEEKYDWFCDQIRKSTQSAAINRNTNVYFGKTATENIFHNICHIPNSNLVSELKGKIPDDLPTIIVAGGPSLKKNIQELKKAKGKAFIIAVDTALPYLREHKIEPDIMITIDPKKPMENFPPDFMEKLPLIARFDSKPEVLDISYGRKLFLSTDLLIDRIYKEMGFDVSRYSLGGSVATAAFAVCIELNIKRIILIGQDLAYDGEFTHAGDKIEKRTMNVDTQEVEGIDGTLVKTRYDWLYYLKWFENKIQLNPSIDCIDATEGGAKIEGTRILKLKDVIDEYCNKEFDFTKVLDGIEKGLSKENQMQVLDYLNTQNNNGQIVKELAQEACKILMKTIKNYKSNGMTKEIEKSILKVKKLGNKIESNLIYSIIDVYIAEFAKNNMSDIFYMESEKQDEVLKTLVMTQKMYQYMIEIVDEIKIIFDDGINQYRKSLA